MSGNKCSPVAVRTKMVYPIQALVASGYSASYTCSSYLMSVSEARLAEYAHYEINALSEINGAPGRCKAPSIRRYLALSRDQGLSKG